METRQYLDLAEQAGKEGAHVAVAIYYRAATESAASGEEAASILELAMEYAGSLKKPADQRALYDWGAQAIAKMQLQGTALEKMVQESIEKLEVAKDGSA